MFVIACGGAGEAHDPVVPDACNERDEKLNAAIDKVRTSPHAVLAVKDEECGTRVYLRGDPKTAQTDSLFRVGSLTKTYVSAAILLLVEDGKVALNDSVEQHMPGLANTDGVTLRMLLNHTSGIFEHTHDETFLADVHKKWEPSELVDLALKHERYATPGEAFNYSNTNYVLLGMIAEKVSGEELAQLIRSRLLEPSKLSHTFLDGDEKLPSALATGYDQLGNDLTHSLHPSTVWASGAMVSTAADLAEWMAALYGGDLLNPSSRQLLVADPIEMPGGLAYGLGVLLSPPENTVGSGPALGHNGELNGYGALALYFPERGLALAGIVDQDGADSNALLLQALLTLKPTSSASH